MVCSLGGLRGFHWLLKVLKFGSELNVPAVVNWLRHREEARFVPWEQLLQSGVLCVIVLGSKLILLSGSGT